MSGILFYRKIANCCIYQKNKFCKDSFDDTKLNEKFIDIIGFNRLENNLSLKLNNDNLEKLSEFSNSFSCRAERIALKSLSCFNGAVKISKILEDHEIQYVFLKATAFYAYNKKTISARPSSDIDIFIKERDAQKAIKILFKNNYRFSKKYPFENRKWDGCLKHKPDILLSDNFGNLVEIHTALFKLEHGIFEKFEDEFLSSSLKKEQYFMNLRAPSVENYILHVIYNYTKHSLFCSGFKFLLDIAFLHEKYNIDWNQIIFKANQINIEKELTLTVLALEELKLAENILKKYRFNYISESHEHLENVLDLVFLNRTSENYLFLDKSFFYKSVVLIRKVFMPTKSNISYEFNIRNNSVLIFIAYPLHVMKEINKIIKKILRFRGLSHFKLMLPQKKSLTRYLSSND